MKYQLIPIRDEFTKKISWALKSDNRIFQVFETKIEANVELNKLTNIDAQFNFKNANNSKV